MAKNGYKVTRSNYTLKEFHKNVNNGVIYERDFMTTENLGGWKGGMFPHGEHGFKMTFNETPSGARKHHYGTYLENECGGTDWTLNCGAVQGVAGSEGKIQIKSDNNTLLSYAYYGNCSELIKSSIRDIVQKYPAELYSTTEQCQIEGIKIFSGCTYVLNNDFGIDLMSDGSTIGAEDNKLRCMALSYPKYMVTEAEAPCGCIGWRTVGLVDGRIDPCAWQTNGGYDYYTILQSELKTTQGETVKYNIRIIRYFFNGIPYYLTDTPNVSIRPSVIEIDRVFEEFDDFERLLLNKKSEPIYTAELDYPHETVRGIETYRKHFTWPLSGTWNLDIVSQLYTEYVNDLLNLADFYDNYRTDNLWRMMTHDSIKNMDITFSRSDKDENSEDYNEGTTKVQGLLWAYGRLFDELKRSIDNIRATNTITYGGQNNVPDYFLSDTLELSGWEVSNATEGLDRGATIKYGGDNEEYSSVDANVKFLSNLKINSKQILSRKGTRYGIEMILGMFGYHSDDFASAINGVGDYTINEYISVASAKTNDGKTVTNVKVYDSTGKENKLSVETYSGYRDGLETDSPDNTETDFTEGLPVSIFYYYDAQGEPWKTVVPWFKKDENLDGNPYFQMKGGWGKLSDVKYLETLKYLSITETIDGLTKISPNTLRKSPNGCICYVSDVSDFSDYFPSVITDENLKHYFIIYDPENADTLGGDGWNPVVCPTEIIYDFSYLILEPDGNNGWYNFSITENPSSFEVGATLTISGESRSIEQVNYYNETSGSIKFNSAFSVVTTSDIDITLELIDERHCFNFSYLGTAPYVLKAGSKLTIFDERPFIGVVGTVIYNEEGHGYSGITTFSSGNIEEDVLEMPAKVINKQVVTARLSVPVTGCQTRDYIEYLESIIDEYRGNNPHVGYGNYDQGEGFFEYFKQIFKGAIDENLLIDDAYDCNTGEVISAITAQGFDITKKVDNKKCWYFYDKERYNLQSQFLQKLNLTSDGYNYSSENMSYVNGLSGLIDVRGENGESQTTETNTIYTEPSVLNRKNLVITFKIRNVEEKKFIESAVLPYVLQVIPSTAILEINFTNRT